MKEYTRESGDFLNKNFRNSVVYQIYIKSFCDSDGDGIGDLNGIRSKLPYLKSLGVDYIWVTPFFPSPMVDNGYDVADYTDVNPLFGTMEDCEAMIREADELGMGFMFDMVFNHTSTQHAWFQKALTGDPEYMDYYIFEDSVDGGPPADWICSFGTEAWEYVPSLDKWYLHLFDKTQADLNWENPRVREELKNVIRFWKDKGVKGFRFDVLNLVSKPEYFAGMPAGSAHTYCKDGRHIHDHIRDLVTETGIEDMVTVGEMASTTLESCIGYSNPDNHELSMCFNFHHLKVDYKDNNKWALMAPDLVQLRHLFSRWQEEMAEGGGWNAVFWCNHDQPRIVSRFGDENDLWKPSAKMLGTFIHLLRGTPYIYQGEEIGMTNPGYQTLDQYRDVECISYYHILLERGIEPEEALHILSRRSRDNGRSPMQWTDETYAGFSDHEPWIGIPDNYKRINVKTEEEDEDSILHYYRKLILLRKEYPIIGLGRIQFLDSGNDKVLAYEREYEGDKLTVLCNFSSDQEKIRLDLPEGKILISNYKEMDILRDEDGDLTLQPYEARAILTRS